MQSKLCLLIVVLSFLQYCENHAFCFECDVFIFDLSGVFTDLMYFNVFY